jgi:hypothetical protein
VNDFVIENVIKNKNKNNEFKCTFDHVEKSMQPLCCNFDHDAHNGQT